MELAGRVLLVSAADRVLLVGSRNPVPGRPTVWVAPGGTAEGPESPRQAASRELEEEVGVSVSPEGLGRLVGVAEGPGRHVEYFALAVDAEFLPSVVNPDAAELAVWVGFRWFSADDLAATTDVVWPRELPDVLRSGVLRDPSARPMTFVWHAAPPSTRDTVTDEEDADG